MNNQFNAEGRGSRITRWIDRFSSPTASRWLWQGLIVAGMLYLSARIGLSEIESSRVLILLIGVGLLCVFLSGELERSLFWSYQFWILTLAVGWRGLWLTQDLRFYAAEAIIWLIFAFILVRLISQRAPLNLHFPKLLAVLVIPFGILGLLTAYGHGTPWDTIWAEYKDYLMAIPTFAVTYWLITDLSRWKTAVRVFIITMALISVLGLIEYSTGASLNIFGSTDVPVTTDTQLGFTRAMFSFWGHPSVAIFLVPALGFLFGALYVSNTGRREPHLWLLAEIAILSVAVYAAGHRGVWLAMGLLLLVFVVFDLKNRWTLLVPYAIGLPFFLPSLYQNILPVLFGTDQYYDTSILNRVLLNNYTLDLINHNPLQGIGWGSVGWVHNDFFQIAAAIGIPALIVFVIWYLSLGCDLLMMCLPSKRCLAPEFRPYAAGLLGASCGLVIMMATEVILPLTPVAIGFWCFLALAARFVELAKQTESTAAMETALEVPEKLTRIVPNQSQLGM